MHWNWTQSEISYGHITQNHWKLNDERLLFSISELCCFAFFWGEGSSPCFHPPGAPPAIVTSETVPPRGLAKTAQRESDVADRLSKEPHRWGGRCKGWRLQSEGFDELYVLREKKHQVERNLMVSSWFTFIAGPTWYSLSTYTSWHPDNYWSPRMADLLNLLTFMNCWLKLTANAPENRPLECRRFLLETAIFRGYVRGNPCRLFSFRHWCENWITHHQPYLATGAWCNFFMRNTFQTCASWWCLKRERFLESCKMQKSRVWNVFEGLIFFLKEILSPKCYFLIFGTRTWLWVKGVDEQVVFGLFLCHHVTMVKGLVPFPCSC